MKKGEKNAVISSRNRSFWSGRHRPLEKLTQIKEQARALNGAPVAMFFSGGKDAIASSHLLRQHHKGPIHWVYLYFVDGLEVIEPTLRHYEKLWKINIDRRPCPEHLSLKAQLRGDRKTHYKYSDAEKLYLEETGIEWICDGQKRSDSLARRGMLKNIENGIDHKKKRIHPVIDWSDKKVLAYCKLNHLQLPKTYSMGMKNSVWVPDATMLIWLRSNLPGDYRKIVNTFPQCGDAVFKKIGVV